MQWISILTVGVLASSTALAATKVACIGNSITFGSGDSNPATQSYPVRLQTMLGPSYSTTNYGLSGRTMLKKGNKPYWNEANYKTALASLPDIVIIELGTNDAKLATNWAPYHASFQSDYTAFVASFQALSSQPKICLNLCPPACKVYQDIHEATIDTGVNPKILNVALAMGTNLIDIHAALTGQCQYYANDGVHPDSVGTYHMAQTIYAALTYKPGSIVSANGILAAPKAFGYQWYQDGAPIAASAGGSGATLKPSKAASYSVSLKIDSSTETRIVTDRFVVASVGILPEGNGYGQVKVEKVGRSLRFTGLGGTVASGRLTVRDLAGRVVLSSMIESTSSDVALPPSARGLLLWQLVLPGRAVSGTAAAVD